MTSPNMEEGIEEWDEIVVDIVVGRWYLHLYLASSNRGRSRNCFRKLPFPNGQGIEWNSSPQQRWIWLLAADYWTLTLIYSRTQECTQVYERIKDPVDTIKAHCKEPSADALIEINTREAGRWTLGQAKVQCPRSDHYYSSLFTYLPCLLGSSLLSIKTNASNLKLTSIPVLA